MAEQITGSGDAFRAAAAKMIGRELKDGEFEQMMQAGLLKPAKLLPMVAVEFKKMVKDSGTLDKKLQQLEAVESRMKQSWEYFVLKLYDSGVEAALKNLYKGIDRVANSVKQLAGNAIGKFLKGALDAISFVALNLLDVFQIVIYLIDQAFGKSSDIKSTTAEVLGWVVAFAAMAKIASGIFKTMKFVAGLSATLGLGDAAKTGMIGKVLILGAEAAFFFGITNAIIDALGVRKNLEQAGGNIWENTHQSNINKSDYGKFDIGKALSRFGIQNLISPGLFLNGIDNLMTKEKPQQVEVKVTMDKNAKDFVRAEINQQQQSQMNMLIPATSVSKPFRIEQYPKLITGE